MAKATRLGGVSDKNVVTSTVTHPKRKSPESTEETFQGIQEYEDDYDEWTVKDLQSELDDRELPTSGRKPELIQRLRESDSELDEDETEDEPSE